MKRMWMLLSLSLIFCYACAVTPLKPEEKFFQEYSKEDAIVFTTVARYLSEGFCPSLIIGDYRPENSFHLPQHEEEAVFTAFERILDSDLISESQECWFEELRLAVQYFSNSKANLSVLQNEEEELGFNFRLQLGEMYQEVKLKEPGLFFQFIHPIAAYSAGH